MTNISTILKVIIDVQSPVLNDCKSTSQGSDQKSDAAEGAKNHWDRLGCHFKIKITIYNTRSIASEEGMEKLKHVLKLIIWSK